ncbi:hypothetical protein F5Y09DRAFT_354613 [Xylaria sp. FL1042]|nr:hypothetical protein F5Y09DRAFT_354613 [Xylaria sp. FL1042]
MEAAGLGIGVIGLIGLFSSCLDMVERWGSYKDFGLESGSIKARFIADRVRFRRWALDDPAIQSAISLILHNIKGIESDAKKFVSRSGLLLDSATSLIESNEVFHGGLLQIERPHSIVSRKSRLGWALGGKARALSLVGSFEILVQKLYDLVAPGPTAVASPLVIENGPGTTIPSSVGTASCKDDTQKILLELEKQIYNETRKELTSWLDAPDTQGTFEDFVLKRLNGTCDWMLNRPQVQQWLSSTGKGSKILWINGPAGYGKTILCARLIEYTLTNSKIQVVYFFFSSEIESRADPFVVLRSWISQLLGQTQQAFDLIREKWEATDGRIGSKIDIKDLFATLVQDLPPCAFVVDGLDEYVVERDTANAAHEGSLLEFISFISATISKSGSHLLIMSRNDLRIREGLSNGDDRTKCQFAELQISPEDVKADASAFSQSIVNRKLKNKSETQREELAHRLVHRCASMFLAIKLLEDDLRGGKNLKQLQRAIDQAPNKLDHIYDRNWERMQRLENASKSRAFSILKWATFAVRPLTVLEITECLLIPDGECDKIDYEELPESIDDVYVKTEILDLCCSLIETRATSNSSLGESTIHLAHFSVRQYILCHMPAYTADPIVNEQLRASNESVQNNILAMACLRYLNSDQTWEEQPAENRNTIIHAFRAYAGSSWYYNIKRGAINSEPLFQMVNSFFQPSNPNWELWRKHSGSYVVVDPTLYYGDEAIVEVANPAIYATLLGLVETVNHLLETMELQENYIDSIKQAALLSACSIGNVVMSHSS